MHPATSCITMHTSSQMNFHHLICSFTVSFTFLLIQKGGWFDFWYIFSFLLLSTLILRHSPRIDRAYKEEEGEALPRLLLFVNCATALSKWAISLSMSASASYPSLPSLPSSSSPSKFCLAAEQRMNNTWKIGNWFLENWILTSSNPTCSKCMKRLWIAKNFNGTKLINFGPKM